MNIPDRIYAQYRTKPKAVAWYNITKSLAAELESAANAVRLMYEIDTALGAQLDILGRIVVIDRNYIAPVDMPVTQFAATSNSPGEFGDTSAMFSALSTDADTALTDELYRLIIKSKIIKNNSDATIESILFGMNFLLPNAEVLRITDGEDMSFSVEFYGNITETERYALLNSTLVPRPQGVRFGGFLEAYGYVQAGDDTMQFGDTYAEFVGTLSGD
jgi:hypothetical protein